MTANGIIMTVNKICCLELGLSGVAVAAIIAANCPKIKVTVVHSSAEKALLWTAKQIPPHFYDSRCYECIRKCHSKNLFFTTNGHASIKDADIILIVSDSKLKTCGEGKGKFIDLTQVREAAHLIAASSDSLKIVVQMSGIPLNATDCINHILETNRRPAAKFHVLSNPGSWDGRAFASCLFEPERVLIGSDQGQENVAAARQLALVYERWVKGENVVVAATDAVALARLCSRAALALRAANLLALAPICEKFGADVPEVARSLAIYSGIGLHPNRISSHFEDFCTVLSALLFVCDSSNLRATSAYWSRLKQIFGYHTHRLVTRLRKALNGNLRGRCVAVFGFTCTRETNVTEGSVAVDLCRRLLDEGTAVRVCDPRVSQTQVVDDVTAAGYVQSGPQLVASLTAIPDPCEAASGCDALVVCSDRSEFAKADFQAIHAAMARPPCLLDCGDFLPLDCLSRIGFRVTTVGKFVRDRLSFREDDQ